MNAKILSIALILLFLTSCGGFEKEKNILLTTEPESKDLATTFEISKDQAEIFKVEEKKPEPEVATSDKKATTKSSKKIKTKKEDKALSAKAASAQAASKSIEANQNLASFNYPADYPQILKDYDSVSKNIWDKFKPLFYVGEQSIMAISYLGVTAGYITISSKDVVTLGDKLAYHYFARFKSKDAYRYFYWLDDSIETYVEKSTFLPIKYSLIQREKNSDVDDLQLFDYKKLKTYHWYKRVKKAKGSNKEEKIENYIPRFAQDSFSALQFVRGLPLKKGDKYDFPVVTRGKPWLLKIEVVGEEMTSVNGNDIKALRLKAETHFPGVLQKSGDINFWYSADEMKKLVKFQAKVKIGSIYGELVEYRPGTLAK